MISRQTGAAPLVPEPDLSRLAGLAASVTSQGVQVSLDNRIVDAAAFIAQLADDLKQILYFTGSQRACRLVHDQYAGIRGQRAGDFNHLAFG